MCVHCNPDIDMINFPHESREEHDMWLFPHGRHGYNVNTDDEKRRHVEAIIACPYCPGFSKEWARANSQPAARELPDSDGRRDSVPGD